MYPRWFPRKDYPPRPAWEVRAVGEAIGKVLADGEAREAADREDHARRQAAVIERWEASLGLPPRKSPGPDRTELDRRWKAWRGEPC